MFLAFLKAFAQLLDPRLRRPLWLGVGAASLSFALLWAGVGMVLAHLRWTDSTWLQAAADAAGGLLTVFFTWLMFPSVATLVSGVFLDDVVAAVEERHYGELPSPRRQPLRAAVAAAGRLALLSLFLFTAAASVGLLLSLAMPGLGAATNLFVFYGVNGYLLTREYFDLVALRRLDADAAKGLWRKVRGTLLGAGFILAVLWSLPVVNLAMPVISAAVMVHLLARYTRVRPPGRQTLEVNL